MIKDIINKLPQATPTLEGEDAIRFLEEMDKVGREILEKAERILKKTEYQDINH